MNWEAFEFWLGLVKSDHERYDEIVRHLLKNAKRHDIGLAAIDCYVGLLFLKHKEPESARLAMQQLDFRDKHVKSLILWISRESSDEFRRRLLRRAWFR